MQGQETIIYADSILQVSDVHLRVGKDSYELVDIDRVDILTYWNHVKIGRQLLFLLFSYLLANALFSGWQLSPVSFIAHAAILATAFLSISAYSACTKHPMAHCKGWALYTLSVTCRAERVTALTSIDRAYVQLIAVAISPLKRQQHTCGKFAFSVPGEVHVRAVSSPFLMDHEPPTTRAPQPNPPGELVSW